VLVVEDDPATRSALQFMLSRQGWEVILAGTLAEGLALLKSARPHSVVLDLMLPDGDGTALAEYVHAHCPEVRVAVTTGVLDPQWLQRVSDAHPTVVLKKPIKINELLNSL
jgi:DNA-binding response OmpR family regulator